MTRPRIIQAAIAVMLTVAPGSAAQTSDLAHHRLFQASAGTYKPYTSFHAPYLFRGCSRWFRVWLAGGQSYLKRSSGCSAGRDALRVKG